MVRRLIGDLTERMGRGLGEIEWLVPAMPELPTLGLVREVEITVYLFHHSPDPEDYGFIFDFERFMAESQRGLFARPVLKVWAGRRDFARPAFARALRESFAVEFAHMQEALRDEPAPKKETGGGWFALDLGLGLSALAGVGWIQTLVLYLAVSTGRAAWAEVRRMLGSLVDRGGDEAKRIAELEARIEEKKAVIDAALRDIEIALHRELWVHAWRGQPPGPMTGMDPQAWPLPAFVRDHLEDRETRSWW